MHLIINYSQRCILNRQLCCNCSQRSSRRLHLQSALQLCKCSRRSSAIVNAAVSAAYSAVRVVASMQSALQSALQLCSCSPTAAVGAPVHDAIFATILVVERKLYSVLRTIHTVDSLKKASPSCFFSARRHRETLRSQIQRSVIFH